MEWPRQVRDRAIALREQGYFYREICNELGLTIPPGTLAGWFKKIKLSVQTQKILNDKMTGTIRDGQLAAVAVNRVKRDAYLAAIRQRNIHLTGILDDPVSAKIALAMLYLGEGRKSTSSGLGLGSSNPEIIVLYLKLLAQCYVIDFNKFRARIQYRADQNYPELLSYWSTITGIPTEHFYKSYIDKRTMGDPTKKLGYKGVCTISYLSNELVIDIITTINILMGR